MSSVCGEKPPRRPETARDRFLQGVQAAAASLGSIPVLVIVALAIRTLLQHQILWGNTLGYDRPTLDWSVLFLALTGPFGILIHEFGHYLAGVALGQYCRRFVIGPIEFGHHENGWSIGWIPVRHAGLVDFVPATFVRFRLCRAVCVAGGPVASLLAGLVFTALSLRAGTPSLFWIWSFSAQWALVGLLGLLPIRRGAASSDGYLLWELIRGGSAVDELERNLLVASSHATPLRIRDWPHDLIRRMAEAPANGHDTRYTQYLAYIHYLDRGEIRAAGDYLDRLMADWSVHDPPEYALEAAYFLGFHGNRVLTAKKWLSLETRDAEPWVRLRAQAAVEWAGGGAESARPLVDEVLARLRVAPACGAHRYEVDRLQELIAG